MLLCQGFSMLHLTMYFFVEGSYMCLFGLVAFLSIGLMKDSLRLVYLGLNSFSISPMYDLVLFLSIHKSLSLSGGIQCSFPHVHLSGSS